MGFFEFFKKKKKIEKEKETISQDKLSEWILNKKKQHQEKEKEFLSPFKERISQLVSELESEILILENIDIDSKKVDLKIKLIVKKNLTNYIYYLQKVIERLEKINKREKIVEKINFIFEDFNKKSRTSYEKITLIIGKEIKATKESIKKFIQDLGIILKDKEEDFKEFETIEILEKDVNKIKDFKENKSEILKILNKEIEKLKILKKDLQNKEKEIEELKKSNKFKEQENKKQELEFKKQELEKEIISLKSLIDFKSLSNFYHTFENEMKLIKEYKENFKQTLQRLGTINLINFLNESKLNNEKISKLIQEINNQKKQILEIVIEDIGINKIEKEIRIIKSEIQTIEYEKLSKEKLLNNLNKEIDEILKEIKDKFKKINIEFN